MAIALAPEPAATAISPFGTTETAEVETAGTMAVLTETTELCQVAAQKRLITTPSV